MIEQSSAILLSGGDSSRMGSPKALLTKNNKTFLELLLSEYHSAGIKKIALVLNHELCDNYSIQQTIKKYQLIVQPVINPNPEKGKFYSIQLGCLAMRNSKHCFLQNIDNPFVNVQLLNTIYENKGSDYTVPTLYNKGGHPILLTNKLIRNIINTRDTEINFREYLKGFKRTAVSVKNKGILLNINTLEDYQRYVDERVLCMN